MTASPYPADIRRPGQRSATGHQQLLVFQISIAVQSRLELLEELLLQRVVQTGIFHLIAELGQQRVRISCTYCSISATVSPSSDSSTSTLPSGKTNTSTASVSPNRLCMLPRIS